MSAQESDRQPGGDVAAHPTNGLDDTVHQRHRLGILTITARHGPTSGTCATRSG